MLNDAFSYNMFSILVWLLYYYASPLAGSACRSCCSGDKHTEPVHRRQRFLGFKGSNACLSEGTKSNTSFERMPVLARVWSIYLLVSSSRLVKITLTWTSPMLCCAGSTRRRWACLDVDLWPCRCKQNIGFCSLSVTSLVYSRCHKPRKGFVGSYSCLAWTALVAQSEKVMVGMNEAV